ncbi:uncharacterized protein CTRU02_201589 [Colletotrichum truncatum]|uniref:Uncharacterized protein n=1 Tax=Colletotrichum truncatum TaxID=5467 RepID=A0ACC3ZIE4_COLTU|nr:uncharacterized protein CTRU02_10816 [Colletotrichum truncatum]KAF6786692.1 hypothetical protein CTRU02_10816 [Colletotrichum truncatum]
MDSHIEMGYRSPNTPSLMSPDAISVATTDKPLLSKDSYYDAPGDKDFSQKSQKPWHINVGDQTQDAPKRVIQRTAPRILTAWLPHAPAISVTCIIVWMSHSQIFWYPESGPDVPVIGYFGNKHTVISNFLQFVSKLHELMVVASLAAIALSMFRRRLVGSGVRLGFLTGGYRLGDLAYLTSSAFWGLGRVGTSEVILVAFVVFGTIMSTIIGPASAILFVPSLGWYDLPGVFDAVKMPLAYSLKAERAWPQKLDNTFLDLTQNPDCKTTESIFQPYCAAGGFSDIWNWLSGFRYTDLDKNITFSSEIGRRLELSEKNSVSLFTTPSSFAMSSIGLFTNHIQKSDDIGLLSQTQRYKLTTKTEMKQPFVQGKCAIYDKDELLKTGAEAIFPTTALNCHGDADCLSLQQNVPHVRRDYWNTAKNDTIPTYTLHHNAVPGVKTVIQIAGTMPYASQDMEQRTWVYACNFLARWVPSKISVDPSVSNIIESNVSSPDTMNKLFEDDESHRGSVITVGDDWLIGIDPKFNITRHIFLTDSKTYDNRLFWTSPMDMILNRFLYRHEREDGNFVRYFDTIADNKNPQVNKEDTETFLAKAYGVFLTDGLSRTSSGRQTFLILKEEKDNITWIDLAVQNGLWSGAHSYVSVDNKTYPSKEIWNDNFKETPYKNTMEQWRQGFREYVQIDFDAERHGYGSGQWSKTLEFALVMMYIYLGIVGIYGAVVLTSQVLDWIGCALGGRSIDLRSVTAWSDLQDLVLLALRSEPPPDADLKHVGAGVGSKNNLWKKVIKVRVGEDNALKLVLHDQDGALPPRKGEKYS